MFYTLQKQRLGLAFTNTRILLTCHANTRLSDEFNRRVPTNLDQMAQYFMEAESYRLAGTSRVSLFTLS